MPPTEAAPPAVKQQVLLLRHLTTSTGLFGLPNALDSASYTCMPYDLRGLSDPVQDVIHLLEERDWERVVLVAHGIDLPLILRLLGLAPERIAGLLLIGLAPSPITAVHHVPTLIVTSLYDLPITARLYTEHIKHQLPISECVPIADDSLLDLELSCPLLAELLHAFCTLRLQGS